MLEDLHIPQPRPGDGATRAQRAAMAALREALATPLANSPGARVAAVEQLVDLGVAAGIVSFEMCDAMRDALRDPQSREAAPGWIVGMLADAIK